jgi:hypothetical protein
MTVTTVWLVGATYARRVGALAQAVARAEAQKIVRVRCVDFIFDRFEADS